MKCVICKTGDVGPTMVEAEVKAGPDRLLVRVAAEVCAQCGEPNYSAEALRHLEGVRQDFARNAIRPPSIGHVYHVS